MTDDEKQLSEAQLAQRRKYGFQDQHGGAGAVRAIQQGKPFKGLAAQAEREVLADLDAHGRGALVVENATRLQTACRLYWGAVCKAADSGDLEALDKYVKRFGWLAGAALRAWGQVKQEGGDGKDATIVNAVTAAREAKQES